MNQRSPFRTFVDGVCSLFFFDPLIYLYTIVMGTLSLLSSLVDRGGRAQHWFARTWSRMILATTFTPVEVIGRENIPSEPAVYAANHSSAIDIPLVYANLPMQFRIMAKVELFRYPFLGWHLTRSGQIPIDEKELNLAGVKKAIKTLKGGMSLMVFPEGGRTPDGEIKKFQSGAFYMAIKAGVPVVPMAIVGGFELLKMNTFVFRRGKLQLVIGKPIATTGYSTRQMDPLAEKVKAAIEEMYTSRRAAELVSDQVVG
ncbi:MAG TPA: lysophospholipid acyltransferase family protein [Terriglobales bacterium]|nr:lysophospholipid acyltransferase family protein [Terriglobales bacterium]